MISSNREAGSAKCEVRGPSVVHKGHEGLQVKTEMTNDEARMTKEARNPKRGDASAPGIRH